VTAANLTALSCTPHPVKSSRLARQTPRARLLKVGAKYVIFTLLMNIDVPVKLYSGKYFQQIDKI